MKFNVVVILTIVISAIAFATGNSIIGISAVALGLVIIAFGIFNIRAEFFLSHIDHPGGILLTFDDGPIPGRTEAILDVLEKNDVRAIFFLIGQRVSQHPEIVERIQREGHLIGNHTQTHLPSFTMSSSSQCIKEIDGCGDNIESTTGVRPTIFRPPYGISNPQIARAVRQLNMKTLGWSVRSLDTVKSTASTMRKLKRKTTRDSVVLLHDHGSLDADHLEEYISHCKSRGYIFTSIDSYKA